MEGKQLVVVHEITPRSRASYLRLMAELPRFFLWEIEIHDARSWGRKDDGDSRYCTYPT